MSSKTLLFADDSATMRSIMEKTFQGEDFDVVTVPSGQAAIEKAKELTPEIIIADAGMTGVNGYDVCEAVRNTDDIAQTPVVIMSGISSPYDDARGKGVDATEHIKKPFDTTKLIDRINELCSTAPRVSAASTATTGPGVAPARPSLNMPPVPKKDAMQDPPSSKSTLHAFPNPGLSEIGAPAKTFGMPPAERAETPVASISMPEKAVTAVEPIELADEESNNEIQVGTLAELAQMNEQGGTVPQEVREDAIELDAGTPEEAPPPSSQASAAASQIHEAASKAAAQIAQQVEGLTSDQAQAIIALTEDVVEKVVWEVVPDLAEAIIREKLDELLKA